MLKARPSALVSSRTAVDLPCDIETTRPWDSSSCMVRISIVVLPLLRPVYFWSRSDYTSPGSERAEPDARDTSYASSTEPMDGRTLASRRRLRGRLREYW